MTIKQKAPISIRFLSVGGMQAKPSDWVLEINLEDLPSRCEIFNIFADLPHQQFSNVKTKRILGFASPR